MITNSEKAKELITDFHNEYKNTINNNFNINVIKNVKTCVELDKPIHIYADQTLDLKFDEQPDYYYLMFGLGENFKPEKVGFEWLCDNYSIFFFERPFGNKVVKVLQKLLPDHKIEYSKNDIIIDGTKNGASLRTGYQDQLGQLITIYNENGEEVTTVLEKSEPLSGMIYILRWDNLDGLNEAFKNSEHHQERLRSKEPLATLGQFLEPIGITKEKFIEMLEEVSDEYTNTRNS